METSKVSFNRWLDKEYVVHTRGDPKKQELIYKKLCIYFYMVKLQPLSKFTLFDAIHLFFSTAENSFWICRFWCLLVLLPFFVSPLPHWLNVSLWGIFSTRGNKKSHLGQDWVNREGGAWESCCIWSKTAEHSVQCGWVHSQIAHCEMGKHVERIFKNIHWSWLQPLTTTPAGTLIRMGS